MKMNNRVLSLVLVLLLSLSLLTGCGSTAAQTAAAATAEPEETQAVEAEPTAEATEAPAETEPQEITITLTVTYADDTSDEYTIDTTADNLYDAIKDTVELGGSESQYGFYIESVNGEEAIYDTDGTYWAIYVNGEYGMNGVDSQPVEDGGSYSLVHEAA